MKGLRRLAFLLALLSNVISPAARAEPQAGDPCSLPAYSGDKVALVVGTDDYTIFQSDKIPNLHNAVNDAVRMAGLLSRQGFVVRCLRNPTQLEFDRAKTNLALFLQQQQQNEPQTADGSRAVIYVAGHGYRDPESNEDYLLFRFEPDDAKYTKVVDLKTPFGRINEGRWSVQSLAQSFNSAVQSVLLILDACRVVIEIPSASGGVAVRAGPMQQLARELMRGHQVVAYSTQPGGVAADGVPDSPEQNGLYASTLSNFINLPIYSLGHALDLTGAVVVVNKQDQVPIYSVSAGTFFLSNPWVDNEPTNICEMVDSEVWNAAGKHCAQLRLTSCIVKDICPVIRPLLQGKTARQASTCLAEHKERWLHNDLVGICSASQTDGRIPTSGGPANTTSPPAAPPASTPGSVPPGGATLGGIPASAASAPAIPPPGGGAAAATTATHVAVSGEKNDAYNVVFDSASDLTTIDFTSLTMSGWATKTPRLKLPASGPNDDQLKTTQVLLDQTLASIKPSKKRAYTNLQRDMLIAKTIQGIQSNTPPAASPSPFKLDLAGQKITLRNLPARSAAAIDTFAGRDTTAEVDCDTLACFKDWIGVRASKGANVYRGWVAADELKSVTKPDTTIEIEYDGKHIGPTSKSLAVLRTAINPGGSVPQASRVHISAVRLASDVTGAFLASARLSYLDRIIIDLGVGPDDITESVIDLPQTEALPPVVVNFSSRSPKPPN
jgi:hypothetical protein